MRFRAGWVTWRRPPVVGQPDDPLLAGIHPQHRLSRRTAHDVARHDHHPISYGLSAPAARRYESWRMRSAVTPAGIAKPSRGLCDDNLESPHTLRDLAGWPRMQAGIVGHGTDRGPAGPDGKKNGVSRLAGRIPAGSGGPVQSRPVTGRSNPLPAMITQHDTQSLPGMQLDGRALVRLGHRNGTSRRRRSRRRTTHADLNLVLGCASVDAARG